MRKHRGKRQREASLLILDIYSRRTLKKSENIKMWSAGDDIRVLNKFFPPSKNFKFDFPNFFEGINQIYIQVFLPWLPMNHCYFTFSIGFSTSLLKYLESQGDEFLLENHSFFIPASVPPRGQGQAKPPHDNSDKWKLSEPMETTHSQTCNKTFLILLDTVIFSFRLLCFKKLQKDLLPSKRCESKLHYITIIIIPLLKK